METAAWWEILLGGLLAALVILWFRPGLKATIERSRAAKKLSVILKDYLQ